MNALVSWLSPPVLMFALAGLARQRRSGEILRRISTHPTASRQRWLAPTKPSAQMKWFGGVLFLGVLAISPLNPMLLGVLFGAVTVLRRGALAQRLRRKGRREDERVVPVLDELARGLRAGLTPAVALGDALDGSSNSAVAVDVDAVLDRWYQRARSPVVGEVVELLRLGRRLGGLRPEYIAAVSTILVERRQLSEEIGAQSSQARASAMVMTIAPLVFFVALVLTNAEASRLMLHSVLGAVLLTVGLTLDLVAFAWMRRIAASVEGSP